MASWTLSGRVLLPPGHFAEATVQIAQGRISQVCPGCTSHADIISAGWIGPGFIDLQINGAWGKDFSSNGQTVAEVAASLPATGVTAFLPTIVTSPLTAYPGLVRVIREAAQMMAGPAAQVLGVHLEGPYLNPLRCGAHDPALLRPIDVAEVAQWAGDPFVRLVTLAPELPGATEAIRVLRRQGIIVGAGHSNATFDQALAGFAAGIAWGTHLFNTMRELGHREPGLPGALLVSDVPCGLIADGIHVHPAMVRLAYRAKGAAGLALVTDAMAAMGMPPGRYMLGDVEVVVDETGARLADGRLAGSILTMDQAVRNVMAFTGCSLAEALTMAATTPARVLGLAQKGRIAPGCDADLVVLDEALRVTHTLVAGEVVYAAENVRRET